MLTPGGESLQPTNDEGDKDVENFSSDGTEIYFEKEAEGQISLWTAPTLGGSPRRTGFEGNDVVPSPNGAFIFYQKFDGSGIFRAGISGMNEELVYKNSEGLKLFPSLLFPGGNDLLAVGVPPGGGTKVHFDRINVTKHQAVDLSEAPTNGFDYAWAEAGKTVC